METNKVIARAVLFTMVVVCGIVALLIVSTRNSTAERAMFTGNEKHVVSLEQAKGWTANFRKEVGSDALIAGFFGKNIFEKLLAQENCVGIRIYNAKHENGNPVFVLVGVDAAGKDLISGVIGEDIIPCPPFCGWPPTVLQPPVGSKPLALAK